MGISDPHGDLTADYSDFADSWVRGSDAALLQWGRALAARNSLLHKDVAFGYIGLQWGRALRARNSERRICDVLEPVLLQWCRL